MVSDFETAEPLICSLINIVIPALCLRSTLKSCPPFLPRIPGGRNDTSRRWHGCHNSAIPLPDKLANTAGLPPSPWESVSKFHCHLWVDMPRVPCWAWRLRRSLGWLLKGICHGGAAPTHPHRCLCLYHCLFSFQGSGRSVKTPFTYRHFLIRFGSVFLHDFQNFSLSRCNACHDAGMGNTFGLCDGTHILQLNMVEP